MGDSRRLTARQCRFIEEYLVDANGTRAAIRAGYSAKTAAQIAAENLRKPEIETALAAAVAARSERTKIDADRVLRELAIIAFSDFTRLLSDGPDGLRLRPISELTDLETRCVARMHERITSSGRVLTITLHDKLAALEKLGRHLGLFSGKPDENAQPLTIRVVRE